MFKLPNLKYTAGQLAPNLSQETFDFHFGKHTKAYVDNLNKLLDGPNESHFKSMSLENIIRESNGPVYNNAAQAWNHAFYWLGLTSSAGRSKAEPSGPLMDAIKRDFGDFSKFKEEYKVQVTKVFGSGWTWLVKDQSGKLSFTSTGNADGPLKTDFVPVIVCDVWEHAYYIDYRNDRAKYFEQYFQVIDWSFAETNYKETAPLNLTAHMK